MAGGQIKHLEVAGINGASVLVFVVIGLLSAIFCLSFKSDAFNLRHHC